MRSSNICFKSNEVFIINHIINELRKKKKNFVLAFILIYFIYCREH